MMKNRRLASIIWLFSAIFVVGCISRPEPPLRVATNTWAGYEPLYLARSLGYFQPDEVRLVEMTSASKVSDAIRNGTVEAAALTLDETLALLQDGVELQVVLVIDVSNGADALVGKARIDNLQDLRGKRVGYEAGATGALMLQAALEAARLRPEDLKLVPLSIDQHLPYWDADKLDAIVTFDPVRSQLLSIGGHVLFDSHQIPGRIVDVLVIRQDALTKQAEHLQHMLSAHFEALQYMVKSPVDAASRISARQGTLPGQAMEQFQGLKFPGCRENRLSIGSSHPELIDVAESLAHLMLDRHLLVRPVSVKSLTNSNFLPDCAS